MAVPLKRGQIRDLHIHDLAFGGKGVGRVEGFVVMVDAAVPGDLVRVRVGKVRGNYAEGQVVELVEPSPGRVP
ncbi:MAG: TRAM domain-containing protein, partial [Planctomycetota bacterium]